MTNSRAKTAKSDFHSAAVEADLDMITYPDNVQRPSLEPGLAHAGVGLGSSGPSNFCVSWSRPQYDVSHGLNGFGQNYWVSLPNLPRVMTDVALVAGQFGDDQHYSLAVAYVDAGTNEISVAHIEPQLADGKVTGLALAGPVRKFGSPYINNGGVATSPALAVGDFAGTGSDQLAVVWAPATSSAANRHYRAALLSVDDQGQLQDEVQPQTITPTLIPDIIPDSGYEQATPGATALRDTRGTGPQTFHLLVGAGIEGYGYLDELTVTPNGFDVTHKHVGNSEGAGITPDQFRTWHSRIESVGDLTGDGLDELVSMPDWGILNRQQGLIDVIDVDDSHGGYRLLDSKDIAPFARMTVLDSRATKSQVIAPVPGKVDPASFPQIAVSATTEGGCSANQRRAFFNELALNAQGKLVPGDPQYISDCGDAEVPNVASFALDGRAELGDPVQGQYTTLEPSVILNAPPTHFDVLGGRMYDPNFCYAGNQYLVPPVCFFTSEYERKTSASTEVTSESTEDWAVSAKASAEFELFDVVSVRTELRAGYGEKFKNVDATTTTDSIEVNVKARNTDKIYAIRRAYDTLEYPIYQPGGTQPSAYVMVTTPHTISKRWIDINSPDAVNVDVNHEPGNILSYPEDVSEQENPFLSPTAKDDQSPLVGAFAQQEFELSDFSDFTYTLTKDKVTADEASTEKEWNVGATLEGSGKVAGLVDVSVEVSGDYRNSNLSNTKTTVGDTTSLAAVLGGIDESFGETAYTVKPFAYWSESAALVLDYAVSPGVAPPGSPKTWWQQQYGKNPDLTLMLPRLLDYEKQAGISSDSARFISPGVRVFRGPCTPNDPLVPTTDYAQPGKPLCLRAQVQNYSLKDQTGDTSVQFYDADPDVGGRLLGTVAGVHPIAARDSEFVYLDWTPDARYAGSAPRIFAKVDSGNAVTEVHEDNNKGYRSYRALADPAIAPRAAEDVEASVGPGRTLDIGWSDPLHAVQPSGHDWRVVAYPDAGGNAIEKTVAGGELSTSISDVPPGRYRVAVFSVSGTDTSPASHPSEPVDVATEAPDAPSNVRGTAGDESLVLQWDPPAGSGGAPVDTYRIQEYRGPGESFPQTPIDTTVTGNTTAMTISGLTNGRPYRFTVQAINASGPGAVSDPSAAVTPLGVPGRATNVKAERGGPGTAAITWDPPAAAASRSPVTAYEVAVSPGGSLVQVPGSATSASIAGLQTGVTYRFTVQPISATGRGAVSDQSNPLTLPDAPSAPRNVRATAAAYAGSATVTWTPPSSSGGVALDSYQVCLVGGECQVEPASSVQTTFSGLAVGTPLVFTVKARNEAGLESPVESSPSLTLAVAPGITLTKGPAEGSFTQPEANIEFVASIADAEITCFIDGVSQACSSPLRLTALSDGKHTFRAKATGPGGSASTALLSWSVDSKDPKAGINDLPAIARKGTPRLRYSGSDRGGAGLAGYDVRTRESGVIGSFTQPEVVTDTTSAGERERRLQVDRGKTLCVSVRASDQVGNRSAWSDWRCTTRPLDQSALQQSGRWATVKGRFFSANKALRAVDNGPALSIRIGRSDAVSVTAVACSDCGRLEVRHRGQLLRVIDLSTSGAGRSGSAAGRHAKEFFVDWPESARGYLRLVSLGGGPVIVDGVTVQRQR